MASVNLTLPTPLGGHTEQLRTLYNIMELQRLTPLFQPIVDLKNSRIVGYEGLIRGPSDSPLHSPHKLLKLARQSGMAYDIEKLCCKVVVEQFAQLKLPGFLFVNFSPDVLVLHNFRENGGLDAILQAALEPSRVVIELSENEPAFEYNLDMLLDAAAHYQSLGYKIALGDLGEGISTSLRRWAELRPAFVKIDRHFIQNIDKDAVKTQFVKSFHEIAADAGCQVIAEGIETHAELMLVRELGVHFGQGYHIARPDESPSLVASAEVVKSLREHAAFRNAGDTGQVGLIEQKLLIKAPSVCPDTPNEVVFDMFEGDEQLHAVVVVKEQVPVGLINRHNLIDRFARPFRHELYGKKPCLKFMDEEPLIVDKNISIQELSHLIAAGDRRHLANGFIITDEGRYLGIGTGHDLIREITEMQIRAARYANPLTQLPGNAPINEHIDMLLNTRASFCACYCDLDHFKPFNDVYGFSQGDAIIQVTGRILAECCDSEQDFLGHIGGDDFFILFGSPDWENRCRLILEKFGEAVVRFFSVEDRERGGYISENRRGEKEFHPLTTLSIGALKVEPGMFNSYMEISTVSAEAKKMAKKISGNSLYINSREYPAMTAPRSLSTEWQMAPLKNIASGAGDASQPRSLAPC
ncbi:MAG TPA: phosphodiesterase [Sulfuricella sp.]|nr:phosphodiesterase [Sulfuricella sp.]